MSDIDVGAWAAPLIPVVVAFMARVIAVLALFWVAVRIAGWLQARVTHALNSRGVDRTLTIFFGSAIRWLVYVVTALACLGMFGVETTSFAAVLGAVSLAVGLAFQGTLSNVASGVVLLVFRPFKVGDAVEISGTSGTVAEIGLFNVDIDTWDNQRIILPNGKVFGSTIKNINYHPVRRADVDVGVAYGADVHRTREVLLAAAASVEGRHPERGHQVVLMGLGGSSVDWQVRVWANSSEFLAVKERTVAAVKIALDAAGIGIPFPQMDVHLDGGLGSGGGSAPLA